MTETPVDERITKKRVTMKSVTLQRDGTLVTHEAVDYVREDFLEAYVRDAETRWQYVEFSEEYDAGPGGYDGSTYVPANLDVPDAGTFYEATGERAEEERLAAEQAVKDAAAAAEAQAQQDEEA